MSVVPFCVAAYGLRVPLHNWPRAHPQAVHGWMFDYVQAPLPGYSLSELLALHNTLGTWAIAYGPNFSLPSVESASDTLHWARLSQRRPGSHPRRRRKPASAWTDGRSSRRTPRRSGCGGSAANYRLVLVMDSPNFHGRSSLNEAQETEEA